MSMVNANGAHTDDISGDFLYIPEGKSSNTLLNMGFMDDLCTECYKRPEKRAVFMAIVYFLDQVKK